MDMSRLFWMRLFLVLVFSCQFAALASVQSTAIGSGPSASLTLDKDRVSSGGGDWESSGGTGVACFEDEDSAKSYDERIQKKEPLDEALIAKIRSLATLERWEKKNEVFFQEGSSGEILERLNGRLREFAPIFAKQLEIVSSRIHVERWTTADRLDETRDAQSEKPIRSDETPHCRQIQLAVRFHKKTDVTLLPELHVKFDSRLYNRLDALDQAMLRQHEMVYVLGRQVGHVDSLRTRRMVRKLFDEVFWKKAGTNPRMMFMEVQSMVDFHLGNYIDILSRLVQNEPSPAAFSSASRFNSFASVVRQVTDYVKGCRLEAQPFESLGTMAVQEIVGLCRSRMYASLRAKNGFSDEEAFVFLHRFVLVQSLGAPNPELTLVEFVDPASHRRLKDVMTQTCDIIHDLALSRQDDVFYVRSARYCTEAGYRAGSSGGSSN